MNFNYELSLTKPKYEYPGRSHTVLFCSLNAMWKLSPLYNRATVATEQDICDLSRGRELESSPVQHADSNRGSWDGCFAQT